MQAQISLSIFGYEKELKDNKDDITHAKVFTDIKYLINSGKLHSLHIDVMRSPFILEKSVFPIKIIKQIYKNFNKKIAIDLHLMVAEPFRFIRRIDDFIQPNDKARISIIIQYESYNQEDKVIKALRILNDSGYRIGIGLDLKTPIKKLTKSIVGQSDFIFLMCVPMGKGGQRYNKQATKKIKYISNHFPKKLSKLMVE